MQHSLRLKQSDLYTVGTRMSGWSNLLSVEPGFNPAACMQT